MNITYGIQNSTSESVKNVILRKFFQMVFMSDDRKSLHIYSASVLGASNDDVAEDNKSLISDLEQVKQFRMRFEFSVAAIDNNEIVEIRHEDITSGEHGFLNEIECIRKVWGDKCKTIVDDQKSVVNCLQILTDGSVDKEKASSLVQHPLLWIEENKSGVDSSWYKSLSIQGVFDEAANLTDSVSKKEVAERSAYTISVPRISQELPRGLELVNWVRTIIQFKYPVDSTDINYVIKKTAGGDVPYTIYSPDFTWYFAPPVKSFIESKNCLVEIKRGANGQPDICNCPLQKQKRTFYSNDKYQNSINPVPNKLTVNFHFWDKEENINARQKYRLSSRDILPTPQTFADISEISIFLDMSDEHNRGNRQFILGLFISFALSFGIDSGRLEEIQHLFSPLTMVFPADVWWILFLVGYSWTLLNHPAMFAKKERAKSLFRKFILWGAMVWFAVAFGVCRSPIYEYVSEKFFSNTVINVINNVMGISLLVFIILSCIYIRIVKVNRHDKFFVGLFGKDIL